jgi:hypothetical protein
MHNAITQALSYQLLTADIQFMCDLWLRKWHCEGVFPSTLVSPITHHSINCSHESIIIYIVWGCYNRPIWSHSSIRHSYYHMMVPQHIRIMEEVQGYHTNSPMLQMIKLHTVNWLRCAWYTGFLWGGSNLISQWLVMAQILYWASLKVWCIVHIHSVSGSLFYTNLQDTVHCYTDTW